MSSHIVDLERAHLLTKSNLRQDEDIYIVQAYVIRAQAREMVGKDRGALEDLEECYKFQPGSRLVKKLIDRLKYSIYQQVKTPKAQLRSKLHQSSSGRTFATAHDSGHKLPTKVSSASRGQSFNGNSIIPASNKE